MKKTILITGSSDGLGLATAKMLLLKGHDVILHGRNKDKLDKAKSELFQATNKEVLSSYVYDLSHIQSVKQLANNIKQDYQELDVLINNAGLFTVPEPSIIDGLDVRFMVNTIAPYILTKELLPILNTNSRVINLSSAAQMGVNINALLGKVKISTNEAYAQSKLALIMWSNALLSKLGEQAPIIISVNPKSFLGTKMVRNAYGSAGVDINIGANILSRVALDDAFKTASGKYFDNDIGQFSMPHPDALNMQKNMQVMQAIEGLIN